MADHRKGSITFRSPLRVDLEELKAAIEKEINDRIQVFEDQRDNAHLLELATKADADFPSFFSSLTTQQVMYRLSSDDRSQVLLGAISTWLDVLRTPCSRLLDLFYTF